MVILVKDDTWLMSRLTDVPSLLYIGGLSLPFRDFELWILIYDTGLGEFNVCF